MVWHLCLKEEEEENSPSAAVIDDPSSGVNSLLRGSLENFYRSGSEETPLAEKLENGEGGKKERNRGAKTPPPLITKFMGWGRLTFDRVRFSGRIKVDQLPGAFLRRSMLLRSSAISRPKLTHCFPSMHCRASSSPR